MKKQSFVLLLGVLFAIPASATETENHGLRVLPSAVTVDGQIGDWDLSGGLFACGQLLGVLTNGHWVRRFHHMIGTRCQLNITPWINFGADNEIELVCNGNIGQGKVNEISLDFYAPGVYP